MKKVIAALGIAGSVTGVLAWYEAHSSRPGAEALALQFRKEHAWIGAIAGVLALVA
jgi:hypothetical protein